jgi:MFS family permease
MKIQNARTGTIILSIAYALAIFQRTAFPQVDAALTEKFHLIPSQIANLSASFFWAYLALQIPSGFLTDALGPRKTSIIGTLIAAFGCILFSVAGSIEMLVVSRLLIATGSTIAFVVMLRYATIHFPEESGTLVGRGMFIGNIGGVMSGIPLALLLLYFSYANVWFGIAILSSFVSIAVAYTTPNDVVKVKFREHLNHAGGDILKVLMSPSCYVGMLLLAGLAGTYYAFCGSIATKVLSDTGIAKSYDGLIMTMLLGGFALGAYFWGWLSDRVRDQNLLLFVALVGSLITWVAIFLHSLTSPLLVGLLFAVMGWFAGSCSLTYKIITASFPKELGGVAVGVMNCGIPLSAACFITLAGHYNDRYVLVPMVVIVFLALACSIALLIQKNWRVLKLDVELSGEIPKELV